MSAGEAERFWRFSLHLYGLPGVEDACLRLQDEGGLNVNLVLWCCWRAIQGESLDEEDIRAAVGRIGHWSGAVTGPLRALRRRIKAELGELGEEAPGSIGHGLYDRLKRAELEAERAEQALLCGTRQNSPFSGTDTGLRHLVRANLETYMAVAGVTGKSPLRTAIPDQLARYTAAAAGSF